MSRKKTKVKPNINPSTILRVRGMGDSNELKVYLANDVVRLSDPYVPMAQGTLKNNVKISRNGETITYPGPYAHYQYTGLVMAGKAPKHYTGKEITYHDSPMRGAKWDRRMLADRKNDLVRDVQKFIRRKGK